jgi:hypothetical protein
VNGLPSAARSSIALPGLSVDVHSTA